jgi:hypothetical protein
MIADPTACVNKCSKTCLSKCFLIDSRSESTEVDCLPDLPTLSIEYPQETSFSSREEIPEYQVEEYPEDKKGKF